MRDAPDSAIVNQITLTDSELAFYRREGYLCLPGFVATAAVERLRTEVIEVLSIAKGLNESNLSRATSTKDKFRMSVQYLEGSNLDELVNGPRTLEIASRLIGGRAIRYLPFAAVKAGGGGTLHFHQDNNYTAHDPALGSINIWVALADMTPENGCLQILPRSHTEQLESRVSDDGDKYLQVEVDPLDCIPIRMRAGDAVAFTRVTVHGSGQNQTDQPRVAYALQYHREDVRWLDKETKEWRLLAEERRTPTHALAELHRQ